MKQQVNAVRSN